MPPLLSYATLVQLQDRQGTKAADRANATLVATCLQKLRTASAYIENETARQFYPTLETRVFDFESGTYLYLAGGELLSLTSLVDGNSISIPTQYVVPEGNQSLTVGPWWALGIDPNWGVMTYRTRRQKCINVTGVWGWHDDYASAWIDSTLTVQGGGISASATTITTSADPTATADVYGASPGISAGALIQLGTGASAEWAIVRATSATALTLAKRGANGTTAAIWPASTPIYVYYPPRDVNEICLRWTSYLMAQNSTDFDKAVITPFGGRMVPPGIPRDVMELLDNVTRPVI